MVGDLLVNPVSPMQVGVTVREFRNFLRQEPSAESVEILSKEAEEAEKLLVEAGKRLELAQKESAARKRAKDAHQKASLVEKEIRKLSPSSSRLVVGLVVVAVLIFFIAAIRTCI